LKPKTSHPQVEQIASELDIHDSMIESIVEILEEKGHIKSDEVDRRTQKKMHKIKK
jgi:DNA-binding MarR family transcriptional regulator